MQITKTGSLSCCLQVHQPVCPSLPEEFADVFDKMVVFSLQFNRLIGWKSIESTSGIQLNHLLAHLHRQKEAIYARIRWSAADLPADKLTAATVTTSNSDHGLMQNNLRPLHQLLRASSKAVKPLQRASHPVVCAQPI